MREEITSALIHLVRMHCLQLFTHPVEVDVKGDIRKLRLILLKKECCFNQSLNFENSDRAVPDIIN